MGLNSLLKDDIVIEECRKVANSFYARYDARGKVYEYRILNRKVSSAIHRNHVWHIRRELDFYAMQRAAVHVVGEQDFKAFEGTGSPRSSTVRRVLRAEMTRDSAGNLHFIIAADGFLRYMVRVSWAPWWKSVIPRWSPKGSKLFWNPGTGGMQGNGSAAGIVSGQGAILILTFSVSFP